MDDVPRAITWEAPEHHYVEKSTDWFFVLLILVLALVLVLVIFGDFLFALLTGLAGAVLAIAAARTPHTIPYAVTMRGIRIDEKLYPYPALDSYHIDEENQLGPNLIIKAKHRFLPLIVIPIPDDYVDEIEEIIQQRLPEEELFEPILIKIAQAIGF